MCGAVTVLGGLGGIGCCKCGKVIDHQVCNGNGNANANGSESEYGGSRGGVWGALLGVWMCVFFTGGRVQ